MQSLLLMQPSSVYEIDVCVTVPHAHLIGHKQTSQIEIINLELQRNDYSTTFVFMHASSNYYNSSYLIVIVTEWTYFHASNIFRKVYASYTFCCAHIYQV